MSAWPLILAGAGMGVAATAHCAAMCLAPQIATLRGIAIVTAAPGCASRVGGRADGWFALQAGRIAGYAVLGALAGFAGQQLLAAAHWQSLFESLWAALNATLLLLGLALVIRGREPAWMLRLTGLGAAIAGTRRHGAWLAGLGWALLPCGTLYSAVALAVLAGEPVGAAAVMGAFGLGSAAGLTLARGGWGVLARRLGERGAARLQGSLLTAAATAGLTAALLGASHPFCS